MTASTVLFFDDFWVGRQFALGQYKLTEDEIIAFGKDYDPQPFHTDPRSPAAMQYGGVIASGWHTTAIAMRLMVDSFLGCSATLVSPGVDQIEWLQPLHAGDVVSGFVQVIGQRRSQSKPDRGLVQMTLRLGNAQGVDVLRMQNKVFIAVAAS
jgi:acyl dehydratase